MKEESKKMWVSKYALTSAVQEVHAIFFFESGKKDFYRVGSDYRSLCMGRDIHESKEAADKAAEAMRTKKLKSLEKQIAQIKAAMA